MLSLKNPEVIGTLLVVFMAIGMMVAMDLGRMLGRRERRFDPKGERAGLGALEGVVFALLGLIVAFTFSGSAERFDRRRTLVTTEVNSIGTAWLRLDLLPKTFWHELSTARRMVDRLRNAHRDTIARTIRVEA